MHPAFRRTDHRPWPLPERPWIGRQRWLDLLFAHWPVPAERLRPFVPAGVTIQEREGTSWVGVVPFRMEDVAPRGLPALPWLSAFPELNLRLYVEVGDKPGVWFVSLDAGNPVAVRAARLLFKLPYFSADMHAGGAGERVRYRSTRRSDPRVAFAGTYAPSGPVFEPRPGTLEHFLTERYCLYTHDSHGHVFRGEIHHPPWPLQTATAEIAENAIGEAQGIALPGPPPLLHFSKRQDVVVWALERVATTAEPPAV